MIICKGKLSSTLRTKKCMVGDQLQSAIILNLCWNIFVNAYSLCTIILGELLYIGTVYGLAKVRMGYESLVIALFFNDDLAQGEICYISHIRTSGCW